MQMKRFAKEEKEKGSRCRDVSTKDEIKLLNLMNKFTPSYFPRGDDYFVISGVFPKKVE